MFNLKISSMKRINFFLIALLAICVVSCEKHSTPIDDTNIFISTIPLEKKVSASGEIFQIKVLANARWTASYDKTKMTVSPSFGNDSVDVTVKINSNVSVSDNVLEVLFVMNGSSKYAKLTINCYGKDLGKNHLFSVSATDKVMFSSGNLIYNASKNTWRFSDNQYSTIGIFNNNISPAYDGWIDLFGWGTSGYQGKYPWMISIANVDYGNGTNDIANTNYDWGLYNKIVNGGDQTGLWRILTKEEWNYLFNTRSNATKLFGLGSLNSELYGIILLPDDWTPPKDVPFIESVSNGLVAKDFYYKDNRDYVNHFLDNIYTMSQWEIMENAGAIFLPAAGYRSDKDIYNSGTSGCYWSASYFDIYNAYYLDFHSHCVNPIYNNSRHCGRSVRLVQNYKRFIVRD